MMLDLGSGPRPLDGYLGVDLVAWPATNSHRGVIAFDLGSGNPWPFADESVDSLYSCHFIEHLHLGHSGYKDPLCHFMDEAWRVAKPGAHFLLRWPSLIDEQTGKFQASAFFDPTHRRFIPKEQLLYFTKDGRTHFQIDQYPIVCDWQIESLHQRDIGIPECPVLEYRALLRKPPAQPE